MSPDLDRETPAPESPDEEFLDRTYERAVALLEAGTDPSADDLLDGRAHLRSEIDSLLRTARQATLLRPRGMPKIPGFALLSEIGRGGMGTVYLARQEALGGRYVALKVLPAAAGMSGRATGRFLAEARAIAGLRHPNIVTVHDVVAEDGVCAYAMEWVEGATLGQLIDSLGGAGSSGRRRSPGQEPAIAGVRALLGDGVAFDGITYPVFVCRLGIAVARALAALHDAGLVHRDVKPSNILLRRDGTPLLSDFGLVHETDGVLTQGGGFAGTVAYASPEQLEGAGESLNARSDVYALGVTLYHAMTLHLPFDDLRGKGRETPGPAGMRRLIGSRRSAPLRSWDRHLNKDLETIVAKAMDPDPARRYAAAGALADDLVRLLNLQPIHARPAGWWSRTGKFLRRHRAAALGVAAGSLASLALAAAAMVWLLLVPRWAAEHVREARLALLDPAQANAVFQAEYWGPPSPAGGGPRKALRTAGLTEALRHYDAALTLAPRDQEVQEERNVVVDLVASSSSRTARETPGSSAEGWTARAEGLAAFLRGDVEEAAERLASYEAGRDPQADPDPLVEAALGIVHLVQDEPARAYPRLREACRRLPDVGFLTTYLADAAVRCRDFTAAGQFLASAAAMPLRDPLWAMERVTADLYAATGRDGEAEAIYRSVRAVGPLTLQFARFLEARGRLEESLDVYVGALAVLQGGRARSGYAAAVERWWASLPGPERVHRLRASLDQTPLEPASLATRLRVYRQARLPDNGPVSSTLSKLPPAGAASPVLCAAATFFRFFTSFAGRFPSPSLETVGLAELADILEVDDMARWTEIPR